jgi:hypothetical protein
MISAQVENQLSLFDTAAVIKPTYKVGDRVKVRKKPIAASYVKKGDIVEIAVVHPIDGSIKFWNERSERWEFIQRDEIDRVITSQDDSPTAVEVVVGESLISDDSPTAVEVVVGESISPHSEIETISPVEAVIESNCLHSKIDSPTPVEVAVGESIFPHSDKDYLDPISIYKPRGTARGDKDNRYYRLSYKEGNKVRQVHIRGGNTDSPIAQAKVAEVRSLLAAGIPPAEIAEMLRNSLQKPF